MSKDRAELQKPLAGAPRFVREVSTQAGRPFRRVVATAVGQRAAEGRCRRALRTAPFRPLRSRERGRRDARIHVPSGRELCAGGDARIRGNEQPAGSRASCRPLLRFVQRSSHRLACRTPRAAPCRRLRKRRPCEGTRRGFSARLRSAYANAGTGGAWSRGCSSSTATECAAGQRDSSPGRAV